VKTDGNHPCYAIIQVNYVDWCAKPYDGIQSHAFSHIRARGALNIMKKRHKSMNNNTAG
jgi:hypothetical protein